MELKFALDSATYWLCKTFLNNSVDTARHSVLKNILTMQITFTFFSHFSMYDVDGNGFIDLPEMTKIVKSIYNMMGPNHVAMDQFESPEARAEGIFKRMDVNNDGKVTKQEFVRCCLEDQKLIELLTPHTA